MLRPVQEEEVEYLDEDALGFDPDEEEDMEDYRGEDGEGYRGSEGELGRAGGCCRWIGDAMGWVAWAAVNRGRTVAGSQVGPGVDSGEGRLPPQRDGCSGRP